VLLDVAIGGIVVFSVEGMDDGWLVATSTGMSVSGV